MMKHVMMEMYVRSIWEQAKIFGSFCFVLSRPLNKKEKEKDRILFPTKCCYYPRNILFMLHTPKDTITKRTQGWFGLLTNYKLRSMHTYFRLSYITPATR